MEINLPVFKDENAKDAVTYLDEHYNNVKALDALNQELFQLCMAEKETYQTGASAFWGISRSWQVPSMITSPWSCGRVKERPLLW